ncbi:BREX protein BrxB domain-containing protein [Desulfobacula sp.]|uniref:BREX protein BrxB domain-containing protein n=1 Tax=Desulfobacula sp. TaxID=2593537 RepID=UPI002610702D|nr:BREX protein BrxB domain-containing protein [Desulfobacula sp.]
MSSLSADFKELIERIKHGRELGHASFEPIFYLIFHPSKILEVKRQMPAWTARLENSGWEVHTFSIAENIIDILGKVPLRKIWLTADAKDPTNWEKTNQSLANALSNGSLQNRLDQTLSDLESHNNAILLVTDLEALHPYMRIGAIERNLQGKFNSPTVFFYPGERTGKTRLKFLGFYPDDGNYRSVHVGG